MSKNKSIISSLPIADFNKLLDSLGLQKTWYCVLATNLINHHRSDLKYILEEKEFKKANILHHDYIEGLSMGEMSVLYEYSLAYVDHTSRKQEGQYFTPDDIAQLLARQHTNFKSNAVWVDPCSGIGNLSYWLIKAQKNPEKFVQNNIKLIDRDPLALFIARFIFTIHFQHKEVRLFDKIKDNFINADFLLSNTLPHYDYAILNPPYVVVPADKSYETAESRDLYIYFLEKVIKTTQGFISITPQAFTNGDKFLSFRRLLLRSFNDIRIYCFDNVPDTIFRGIKFGSKNTNTANSTRAGIIVAKQNTSKSKFGITPLLRWPSSDRKLLLAKVESYLTYLTPTEKSFPKVHKSLLDLYIQVTKRHKILAQIVSKKATPYSLTVPSTPRYYISALKYPVNRSSFKTLYFYNQKDMNSAYLLLNSSFMYWWWRVNDGGMTISEKTLLTLPLIDLQVNNQLILKLEESEKINKVIKRNAGKDNENVKHPPELIRQINYILLPDYANELEKIHSNTVL